MIKKCTYLFAVLALTALYSCQKIGGHVVSPSTGTTTGGSTSGGTTSGGTTGGGTVGAAVDTTKTYEPNKAGTYAKYSEVIGTSVDTVTDTWPGNTSTINSKLYDVVTGVSLLYGTSTAYFSNINHVYTFRGTGVIYGTTVEIEYLIDNVAVGATWTAKVTDNGTVNGAPAQIIGKIIGKNISKTVSGQIFTNVIHTQLQLQYDLGMGYVTYGSYDYYVAKGVGVVESDATISGFGTPSVTSKTLIVAYSIK